MAKKKIKIDWKNESKYDEIRDPITKVVSKFYGRLFLHGICFKFSTSSCSKHGYILRVVFNIINPVTGHILHRLGDSGDKTCTGDIYIPRTGFVAGIAETVQNVSSNRINNVKYHSEYIPVLAAARG